MVCLVVNNRAVKTEPACLSLILGATSLELGDLGHQVT